MPTPTPASSRPKKNKTKKNEDIEVKNYERQNAFNLKMNSVKCEENNLVKNSVQS